MEKKQNHQNWTTNDKRETREQSQEATELTASNLPKKANDYRIKGQ